MSKPRATRLVICAKSRWHTTPRREHLLAMQAAREGVEVTFVERPEDVRALRGDDRRAYLRSLLVGSRPESGAPGSAAVGVVRRSTIAPGHRGGVALLNDSRLLRRDLERYDRPDVVVVATTPWFWPAVAQLRHARRAVDLGDDWSTLIPARADLMAKLHARIASEADAVVVASESLVPTFAGRAVTVRNATDSTLVNAAVTPLPRAKRMVYVGTLSERFDVSLVRAVLAELPDWTLELYGPCLYAGGGDRPDADLQSLLDDGDGRVVWHGGVDRSALAASIDRGDVLLIPNRAELAAGQDSMKLYDYLARARPVVATRGAVRDTTAPGVQVADNAVDFAAAVRRSESTSAEVRDSQRTWATKNTYADRWPQWWAAIAGATADEAAAA